VLLERKEGKAVLREYLHEIFTRQHSLPKERNRRTLLYPHDSRRLATRPLALVEDTYIHLQAKRRKDSVLFKEW
jgi:hypothetical protein